MVFIENGTCEPLRVWSRLEPRARQVDFADALAARVHDPMFLLARQWQFGEFAGEDGGSAVLATIARRVTPVSPADVEDPDAGLEPVVESLPIPFPAVARARLGRAVLGYLDAAAGRAAGPLTPAWDPDRYRRLLVAELGVTDDDPADTLGAARDRAAPRTRRVRRALHGRSVDGLRVLAVLPPATEPVTAAALPTGLATGVEPGHLAAVLEGLADFRRWFHDTYGDPAVPDGWWRPDRLEYGGALTTAGVSGTHRLSLDEHAGTDLDWHSFDTSTFVPGTPSSTVTEVRTVIPTPAEFPGMPKPRWWQFEDAAVDLGKLRADTTDVARIVVTEFAVLFGNNWFVVPSTQPVGSITEVDGAVVTDVFGWRTMVTPPVRAGVSWADWDLFSVSARPSGAAPSQPLLPHLYVPATLGHHAQGEPLESVTLVRDESADLVWAIEQRVPDGLGGSRDGDDAARRLRQQQLALADAGDPVPATAALRYVVQSDTAENWIPFLPVHVEGELRATRLQRGAMRRELPPEGTRVRPVTSILRPGIADDDATALPYHLDEEEVPRAGVVVSGALRRARRFDGVPVVWHARTVRTGRGGGRSGLEFDRAGGRP